MSKLLTIFLLLYGICQNTVAPKNEIKPHHSASSGSENGNQNEYDSIIPAGIEDIYQHDRLTNTTQLITSTPFTDPSIIDNNDVIDVFNISTYKSVGREKRLANKDGYFAMKGSAINLPCWNSGPMPFEKTHKDTKAIWRDVHNNAIANSRYRLVKHGDLQIRGVEFTDTGKFTCRLKGTKKTKSYFKNIKLKSTIPLAVFTLPTYEMDIIFVFRVQLCPVNTKTSWLTQKVTKLVKGGKSNLPLKFSSKCTTKANSAGKKEALHTVVVTQGMPKTYRVIHICRPTPSCIEQRMKSYLKMMARFVIMKVTRKYNPLKKDLTFKKWCTGGNWLYKKIMCLQCKAGTFSRDKSEKCTPCAKDKYQDKMGMKLCNKCPKGKSTQKKKGATSVSQCKGKNEVTLRVSVNTVKIEHYLAIAVVPVIIVLVFVLVCVIKGRKKDDEKKDQQHDDQHGTVSRHAKDEYESEMGPTTEMETDMQTSGSELEVEQVRRPSMRSTSGSKRNVNNSHKMPNAPSSESLADANNANFNHRESFRSVCNAMPQVGTSPRGNQPNSLTLSKSAESSHCHHQVESHRIRSAADVFMGDRILFKKFMSQTGSGSNLAARLSVADLPENTDLLSEVKKASSNSNVCTNNSLSYSPFHGLKNSETKNKHHTTPSTYDHEPAGKPASSFFPKDFLGSSEQVTKSIKVLTYPGMATYNNPACLPKAVTISKYSDSAIKDLFFIEPHKKFNSINLRLCNATNESANHVPSDIEYQSTDNFSSSSIQNGSHFSEHVLCNAANPSQKELILSETPPPESNSISLHSLPQDDMSHHTTSDSGTSLDTGTSVSTSESEKST